MAKKLSVKSKSVVNQGKAYSVSANVGTNPQLSANMGNMGNVGSTIAANVGSLSQQVDAAEQSKMVDNMRKKAKKKPVAKVEQQMQVDPPGTFRNVDNQLVIGDMKKFRKAQVKRKK